MKYKVGDKVRIKSKEWWNAQPKDEDGSVKCGVDYFTELMTLYCGQVATISSCEDGFYLLKGIEHNWTDGMFKDSYNPEKTTISGQMIKDIADVIKKHNLGVCVSENDGKIIIEPLNKKEEDDLPINTPCMVTYNTSRGWILRYYAGNKKCFNEDGTYKYNKSSWRYIIPFDKFNPNNIEESLKYNIVKK